MLRRSNAALATAIPRHVWDPKRANPNWADSYSTDIADRRQWPAKRWSIGLEPRTPTDWLTYSTRNLAYAYNGALRACSSFPEMISYYQEMKQRGVAVDLDTMNVLLTRAARYENIVADDVFKLFEEMLDLGAKPDLSVVETLHTVFDHHYTANAPGDWRELRRRRLVELYNRLCAEDIAQYAGKDVPHLLQSQVARYRENLKSLGTVLSTEVMRQYVAQIDDPELLVRALHDYLWDFVPRDHPCVDLKALGLQIPRVGSVLRRQLSSNAATPRPEDFDDNSLNEVFCAAVERAIDAEMTSRRFPTERSVLLALMSCIWQSGVYVSANVIAQVMDAVKFSSADQHRDQDSMRYFAYASRVSVIAKEDSASAAAWVRARPVVDCRVIGRFLAARDPWSSHSFTPNRDGTFAVGTGGKITSGEQAAAPAADGALVPVEPTAAAQTTIVHDDAEIRRRWAQIEELVKNSGAFTAEAGASVADKMEIFTGKVCFLRNALFPGRYMQSRGRRSEVASLHPTAAPAIFDLLKAVKMEMDTFIAQNPTAEPELECFEGMLLIARGLMDLALMARGEVGADEASSTYFASLAEMRSQLLVEARTRFKGRFRILWLQDA